LDILCSISIVRQDFDSKLASVWSKRDDIFPR
jgi:hypothetical protein